MVHGHADGISAYSAHKYCFISHAALDYSSNAAWLMLKQLHLYNLNSGQFEV
jgi:hypothetical protein